MEVSNPRRILAVSLEEETHQLTKVIKGETCLIFFDGKIGDLDATSTSLAGTSHDLHLKTAYYTATVPIWIDLIASPSEWAESFLSEEAGEVLAVLGGLIVVFALPSSSTGPAADKTRTLIQNFGKVVKKGLGGWSWDGVGLAIGVGSGPTEDWDELCAGEGLEFVQIGPQAPSERNEFGEKTGIARVTEALETNDWAQLDEGALSDFGEFETEPDKDMDGAGSKDTGDLDPGNIDFGFDKADFEGMRKAVWENNPVEDDVPKPQSETKLATEASPNTETSKPPGQQELDDDEVAKVEKMMRKLQAVREAGEGMGEEQRKRMAARAVREVMADLED